jgi:hypothetical protein
MHPQRRQKCEHRVGIHSAPDICALPAWQSLLKHGQTCTVHSMAPANEAEEVSDVLLKFTE